MLTHLPQPCHGVSQARAGAKASSRGKGSWVSQPLPRPFSTGLGGESVVRPVVCMRPGTNHATPLSLTAMG